VRDQGLNSTGQVLALLGSSYDLFASLISRIWIENDASIIILPKKIILSLQRILT
jgi:hypothetical protein